MPMPNVDALQGTHNDPQSSRAAQGTPAQDSGRAGEAARAGSAARDTAGPAAPIELTVTAERSVEGVQRAFSRAMADQQLSRTERETLQDHILDLSDTERRDLYRSVVRTDAEQNALSSDLKEFFQVLNKPSDTTTIIDFRSDRARQDFIDVVRNHATVDQRSAFIGEAAPEVTRDAGLARAVGAVMTSLDGNATAMYEAVGDLFNTANGAKNPQLKAVLDASIVTENRPGGAEASHEPLNELLRAASETLSEGRRKGEISDTYGRFYTAAVFEAGSRVAAEAANDPASSREAVNATLGALTGMIARDGAALANALGDGYASFDGGLARMFEAALDNDNTRAIGGTLALLRAPVDQLAGRIDEAAANGDARALDALREQVDGSSELRALQHAGAAVNEAITAKIEDLNRQESTVDAIWTGTARSAGTVAGFAAGGLPGLAVSVGSYVAYAGGQDVIARGYHDARSEFSGMRDAYEYVLTPRNTNEPDAPKLNPGTQVAPDGPASTLLRELKDEATASFG